MQSTDRGLVITGRNLTPQTTVRVDGVMLPTRMVGKDRLLARLAPGLLPDGRAVQVDLTDGMRESSALPLLVRRPSLTRLYSGVHPRWASVQHAGRRQRDPGRGE